MAIESRSPQVLGVGYTFVVLTSIATLLRVYCRGFVIKAFAIDDWLAVGAQILFLIFCAYEITGVKYGTGRHNKDLESYELPKAMQMWWTCEPLYVLANMFVKASIAIYLLRLCVHKYHKIIIWTVTVVTEVYSLFFFLLFVLQCRPTSLFWLRYTTSPPSGHCIDAIIVSNAFYAYSAISCLTDWTFSLLPIMLVWNLQMNRRTKLSVVAILACGVIASSATIVRFPYLHTLNDINDFLYSTVDVAIWSTVETGLGICAAAVATLRPLLKTFFGSHGGSSGEPGASSGGPISFGKSGASKIPRSGYIRSHGTRNEEDAFDMNENIGKRIGVTTVINYDDDDVEAGRRNRVYGKEAGDVSSDGSSVKVVDDWNSSQSNLASPPAKEEPHGRGQSAWNINVTKTVVQTSGQN